MVLTLFFAPPAARKRSYGASHRATLLLPLGRKEELAEVSLKNGDDRLASHPSLKVARLGRPASVRLRRSS